MFTTPLPETYKWEDVFDAWDAAAHDAKLAWNTWLASDSPERGDAYAAYRASLEREERAAEVLAGTARSPRGRRGRFTSPVAVGSPT